jgi:tetratricopeptide (TPR) repeat protein
MAALFVLLAVVAIYVQSLGGPFLWDDRLLILDAPLVQHGGSLSEFLSSPFWTGGSSHTGSTSYYRPLAAYGLFLDHTLHGENPAGYHLTNVALHALNSLALFALLRKHGTRPMTSALVAAGFSLQPRLAEAAAWISGRTDLLAALFTLLGLCVWGPSAMRRIAAALLVGIGLLGKETAIAGALAIAAGEWVARADATLGKRAVRTLENIAPVVAIVVLYAALRVATVGLFGTTDELGAIGRIRTILEAVGTYAAMLVDAWRPRAIIGRVGAPSTGALAAGVAVVVLVAVLFRFRSRLERATATGLALFFGALVPVLHIVPIPLLTLTADRFLYLPTAGLALALAPSIDRFLGVRRTRYAGALALVASFAIVTFQRVGVWSNEIDFWVTTYRETPATNNAAARELANVYYRAGLVEDALILSERALRYDDPHRANSSLNAALCLARLGRFDEARTLLVGLQGKRGRADIELELARLEARAGNFERARELLRPLAKSRDAALLSKALPELERARRELDRLDESSHPGRRAMLATIIGDEERAIRAWIEFLRLPNVEQRVAEQALLFLVAQGDYQALREGEFQYQRRFGVIEPRLAGRIATHLAELDRLEEARVLVGLSGPERTKKIAVPEG